ncbi:MULTISPECIES: type II toxin-antitoxin system VapC family toxin [Photorhabdus]|uniref:ABC transporter substrate-binding protein n=1 Tax=Photorhabdus thracensis TaxID=230089 RepID=A0A0F7LL16_9GAMM|nr:type II toxin-antitoxin system VapC family toxin [Photorhabdus thracensis]AKH62591.1 ABC transporter substrate-binding protein [Photorhabdus thracensis]
MKRYMLDINVIGHLIREHHSVVQHVLSVPMSSLCISAITKGELLFGLARRPEAKRLHTAVREFLRRVDVLPWDSSIAECYGTARTEMERQGRILTPLDLLIAVHAINMKMVLVTNDHAFQYVQGLHIEDWTV